MAFNEQEQKIIDYGIKNKKSQTEVMEAIAAYRSATEVPKVSSAGTGGILNLMEGFAVGAGKGTISTLQNIGNVVAKPVGKAFGVPEEQIGFAQETLEPKTGAEKAGMFTERIAEFAIPQAKLSKVASFLGLGSKATMGARVATSGAVATAQEGEIGKETAIAGGAELVFPGASKAVKAVSGVFSRLFKGLGSTTSGVGTEAIESMVKNPETAKQVVKQIATEGTEPVIRQNAQTILNGVRTIKSEARESFGAGLESLKKVDINPKSFRNSVQSFMDTYNISTTAGKKTIANAEFDDPKLLSKANDLINKVTKVKLNGKDLRTVIKEIDSTVFKSPGQDPQRLSYNAFAKDLSKAVTKAVKDSTDKLGEINKSFSTDMQLADGIEKIFGKMKYYNERELVTASEKLSQLFNKKGLAPTTIDKFLTRIGVSPEDFRTTEAVRQITEKDFGANQIGTTVGEFFRSITSSLVTPDVVRDVAIKFGTTGNKLAPVLNAIEPALRPAFIVSMIELFSDDESQQSD
jgi:hypothetical protein